MSAISVLFFNPCHLNFKQLLPFLFLFTLQLLLLVSDLFSDLFFSFCFLLLFKLLKLFLLFDQKHALNELILDFVKLALTLDRQKLVLEVAVRFQNIVDVLCDVVNDKLIALDFVLQVHHLLEQIILFHLSCLLLQIVPLVLKVAPHQFSDLRRKISIEVNHLFVACVCFKLLDVL